jgi:hypothetical protein
MQPEIAKALADIAAALAVLAKSGTAPAAPARDDAPKVLTYGAIPCTIDGVTYASKSGARVALHLSWAALDEAIKRGTIRPHGDDLLSPPHSRQRKPTTIAGVAYPSQHAASKATGILLGDIGSASRLGLLHLLKPTK